MVACAGIDRDQVNYINAHATSTLVGDIAEVKAVRSVFSDWSHIKMNGTKSLVGHCLGAAAGVEAIATIQAIVRGEVHPTINHEVRRPSTFRLITKAEFGCSDTLATVDIHARDPFLRRAHSSLMGQYLARLRY
jgi:3-oxoacyl-(acyl-carrier-protein) synthase